MTKIELEGIKKGLIDKRISKSAIARILGVHRLTVSAFASELAV